MDERKGVHGRWTRAPLDDVRPLFASPEEDAWGYIRPPYSPQLMRLLLMPQGDMDLGLQRDPHVAVAQHLADAFDIHILLDAACGVGVPQGMEISIQMCIRDSGNDIPPLQ